MKNRWSPEAVETISENDIVATRVYSSRLLGAEPDLVLHGGGNTSVKGMETDVFGNSVDVLYVKGSGWDLKTIEAPGFPVTKLDYLTQLGNLDSLSDTEMMRHLRLALLNPSAPTPSVEAILHSLIPFKYVDHSHADAIVTLSNTPDGEKLLAELYGSEVLILPYIMPGFVLAKQVAAAAVNVDWQALRGIVLLHHGIFTFNDDAKTSYDTMIELVSMAEDYLDQHTQDSQQLVDAPRQEIDLEYISQLRKAAGVAFGGAIVVGLDDSEAAVGFACREDAAELIQRGPLTPDHTIHAKPFGAVFAANPEQDLAAFVQQYTDYYRAHSKEEHQILDAIPRYGVWQDRGMVYLAPDSKRLKIVADITSHTIRAIQQAEALGGWEALPREELFKVEYWELEQAKLKSGGKRQEFEGKVAVVSGAASGIGKACAEALAAGGAAVLALDIAAMEFADKFSERIIPVQCDVTDKGQIRRGLTEIVRRFGGIDLLVSNAGNFPASAVIEHMDDEVWQHSVDLNMNAHMRLLRASIPFLKNGFDPAVVIIGSKNVPAPGPGAAAYSVAKAGLNQLARIAALELGEFGIRVNSVHPDAIYDTALWNDDVVQQRAAHYGQTVEAYRSSNILGTELHADDVAATVVSLLGQAFSKTTGAQIAIDGGNERVI